MKIVKKISVCWKIQNTQITSLPPLKKKKDILDGGGERRDT